MLNTPYFVQAEPKECTILCSTFSEFCRKLRQYSIAQIGTELAKSIVKPKNKETLSVSPGRFGVFAGVFPS